MQPLLFLKPIIKLACILGKKSKSTATPSVDFDVSRNLLSLQSFATSLKKISLKSDFIPFFFMILYMYIAPGQRLTIRLG